MKTTVVLVCTLALAAAAAAQRASTVPPSMKTRTPRFRTPEGCAVDDFCPEHLGTYYFNVLDAMLPPDAKSVYLKEAVEPMVSRIYSVADADGQHVTLWQMRTVTILPEPRGLAARSYSTGSASFSGGAFDRERHVMVPFLFDTIAPHVYLGKKAHKYLEDHGTLDGAAHEAICNLRMPLPHADVRCLRRLGPSQLANTNDARKNIIGGAAATSIFAVHTAFNVAFARGEFRACEANATAADAVECVAVMERLAQTLMETDPTFVAILANVVPKDTGSRMAIDVTINATRRERREWMQRAIRDEFAMLLRAPREPTFDADTFIAALSRKRGASTPSGTIPSASLPSEEAPQPPTTMDTPASAPPRTPTAAPVSRAEDEDEGEF
jgi:hypothetical protein